MALTPAEQKKLLQIEQDIANKLKESDAIKQKGADDFSRLAMKFNLWKLDKKTAEFELKTLSEKYKTL